MKSQQRQKRRVTVLFDQQLAGDGGTAGDGVAAAGLGEAASSSYVAASCARPPPATPVEMARVALHILHQDCGPRSRAVDLLHQAADKMMMMMMPDPALPAAASPCSVDDVASSGDEAEFSDPDGRVDDNSERNEDKKKKKKKEMRIVSKASATSSPMGGGRGGGKGGSSATISIGSLLLACAASHAATATSRCGGSSAREALLLAEAAHERNPQCSISQACLAWRLALYARHTHDVTLQEALEKKALEELAAASAALLPPLTSPPSGKWKSLNALQRRLAVQLSCTAGLCEDWALAADLAERVVGSSLLEADAFAVAILAHSALRNSSRCDELLTSCRPRFPTNVLLSVLALLHDERSHKGPAQVSAILSSLSDLAGYALHGLGGAVGAAELEASAIAGHQEPNWSATQDTSRRLLVYYNLVGRAALRLGLTSAAKIALSQILELLDAFPADSSSASSAWSLRSAVSAACGALPEAKRFALRAAELDVFNHEPLGLLSAIELQLAADGPRGDTADDDWARAEVPFSVGAQPFSPNGALQTPLRGNAMLSSVLSPLSGQGFFDTAASDPPAPPASISTGHTGWGNADLGSGPSTRREDGISLAVFYAQRALRCDRRSVLALQSLGRAKLLLGDVSGAAEVLAQAAAIESRQPLVPLASILPFIQPR